MTHCVACRRCKLCRAWHVYTQEVNRRGFVSSLQAEKNLRAEELLTLLTRCASFSGPTEPTEGRTDGVVTVDVLYDHSEGTPWSFPGGHLWYCRNKILIRPKRVFFPKTVFLQQTLRRGFHLSQRTLAGVEHYLQCSGGAPIWRLQQSWLQGPAFTAIEENRFCPCRQEAGSDWSGEVGIPYIGRVIQSLPSKQAPSPPHPLS